MRNFRAAAVQLRFSWREKNLEQVRDYIFAELVRARAAGANLAVLPAYTGLLPLKVIAGHGWSFERGMWSLIARHGLFLEELLVDWGREMARHLGLFVCPGSVLVPSEKGVQNVAHIFGPGGELLLRQAQTHTTSWERGWGLTGSDTLEVADFPFGRLALVVGTDAWFPEVARILTLQGANVLLAPVGIAESQSVWHQVAGMWQEVQQNQVFGVEASLVGTAGRVRFAGRSSVLGPVEITPGDRGYYEQIDSPTRTGVAFGTLDFVALRDLALEYPLLGELNPELYNDELLPAYSRAPGMRGEAP